MFVINRDHVTYPKEKIKREETERKGKCPNQVLVSKYFLGGLVPISEIVHPILFSVVNCVTFGLFL